MENFRLHRALKHPKSAKISNLLHKSLGDAPMLPDRKGELESMRCFECPETTELPRKHKLKISLEGVPNVVVSLNVVQRKIKNKSVDILVMIDHGDVMIRLKMHKTTFNAFYSRWIATYDAQTFVLFGRDSNLAAELMKE